MARAFPERRVRYISLYQYETHCKCAVPVLSSPVLCLVLLAREVQVQRASSSTPAWGRDALDGMRCEMPPRRPPPPLPYHVPSAQHISCGKRQYPRPINPTNPGCDVCTSTTHPYPPLPLRNSKRYILSLCATTPTVHSWPAVLYRTGIQLGVRGTAGQQRPLHSCCISATVLGQLPIGPPPRPSRPGSALRCSPDGRERLRSCEVII